MRPTPLLTPLRAAVPLLLMSACAAPQRAPAPAQAVDLSPAPPPAAAPAPPPVAATQARQGYLPAAPDGTAIVSGPPAAGTLAARADRAAYDKSRTLKDTPRWRQAVLDVDLTPGGAGMAGFSCAVGAPISQQETPATVRLLSRLLLDAHNATAPAKQRYQRVRPFTGNTKPICVPRDPRLADNGSYPSGHAAAGWLWGLSLAAAAPERATAILARGRAFGDSRVVCGVHYPTDVEAGRTLAAGAFAAMSGDGGFRADLEAARAELAAARGRPGAEARACAAPPAD